MEINTPISFAVARSSSYFQYSLTRRPTVLTAAGDKRPGSLMAGAWAVAACLMAYPKAQWSKEQRGTRPALRLQSIIGVSNVLWPKVDQLNVNALPSNLHTKGMGGAVGFQLCKFGMRAGAQFHQGHGTGIARSGVLLGRAKAAHGLRCGGGAHGLGREANPRRSNHPRIQKYLCFLLFLVIIILYYIRLR